MPLPESDIATPLLATTDAARWVGCSPRTMEKFRQTGGGPVFLKIGRSVLYARSDLEAWLHSCRRVSTADQGGGAE